jgi:hypothetical protein
VVTQSQNRERTGVAGRAARVGRWMRPGRYERLTLALHKKQINESQRNGSV